MIPRTDHLRSKGDHYFARGDDAGKWVPNVRPRDAAAIDVAVIDRPNDLAHDRPTQTRSKGGCVFFVGPMPGVVDLRRNLEIRWPTEPPDTSGLVIKHEVIHNETPKRAVPQIPVFVNRRADVRATKSGIDSVAARPLARIALLMPLKRSSRFVHPHRL